MFWSSRQFPLESTSSVTWLVINFCFYLSCVWCTCNCAMSLFNFFDTEYVLHPIIQRKFHFSVVCKLPKLWQQNEGTPFCQKQMQDVKTVWQWVASGTLVYPGLGIHTSILKLTLVLKAAGYKVQLQAHHWHKYVNNSPFQGTQVSLKLPWSHVARVHSALKISIA